MAGIIEALVVLAVVLLIVAVACWRGERYWRNEYFRELRKRPKMEQTPDGSAWHSHVGPRFTWEDVDLLNSLRDRIAADLPPREK